MAETTGIEWSDATWNPITGCALVSEGCRHCYAARLAATRLKHHPSRAGLARLNAKGEAKFTGEVRFNEQWLDQPLRWTRPRKIFVCAHGDLFAENVPDAWIDQVFAVMALSPRHVFQVLTKRAKRMREYVSRLPNRDDLVAKAAIHIWGGVNPDGVFSDVMRAVRNPLPNVWLGVSAEDQATADERVPQLLATPAAIRFVSAEPLLGPIDFERIRLPGIVNPFDALRGDTWGVEPRTGRRIYAGSDGARLDWIIVGGESGPSARPMHRAWSRQIRDACADAGTAFFFKQWGAWSWRADRADGGEEFEKVGKTRAGRLLDGVEHSAFPGARP